MLPFIDFICQKKGSVQVVRTNGVRNKLIRVIKLTVTGTESMVRINSRTKNFEL